MERRRQAHATSQHVKFYQIGICSALLVINCAVLICYFKIYHLLFRPSVHFWVYFVTGVFILTKAFMMFAFYTSKRLLIDLTLFLCVILLIFQFLWGLIATFSVVINADNIADNITSNFPEDPALLREMKEFEDKNNCCFKELHHGSTTTPASHSISTSDKPNATLSDKPACKSCIRVNKEKARNIAVFLITAYILIFVGLTAIILLIIL